MNTVCIVGVGLIGGSFALALRKAGFGGHIIGVSSAKTIERSVELGVVDEGLPLPAALPGADLVYLAQPIQTILETIETLDQWLRPGTIVTDVGSTKGAIVKLASERVRNGIFVGGHPMAGKETRGVESADADLFRDRPYILTSRNHTLEEWIARIGAKPVFLNPGKHDAMVAISSHVPQLASTALASLLTEDVARVAGPGAVDMTRLALSSYEIWHDILATNPGAIEQGLDAYIAKLQQVRNDLRSPAMEQHFAEGAGGATLVRKR